MNNYIIDVYFGNGLVEDMQDMSTLSQFQSTDISKSREFMDDVRDLTSDVPWTEYEQINTAMLEDKLKLESELIIDKETGSMTLNITRVDIDNKLPFGLIAWSSFDNSITFIDNIEEARHWIGFMLS